MNKPAVRLLVIFVAVLLGSGLLVYFLLERAGTPVRNTVTERSATTAEQPNSTAPAPGGSVGVQNNGDSSIITELFGRDVADEARAKEGPWDVAAARMLLRFLIAALLAAGLAFRWRRGISLTKRNPYVAQTQILLAVVAAAMMMIVGDSAARAFGIFAAASLVRFRTNIRDPKETTVLLVCLGVGLACGVGRLDMAVILAVFVLLTLWLLEHFEEAQVFRSMELCVATRNVDHTNEVIKQIFARRKFDIELRELDREDGEDPLGKIVYLVNLNTTASTDELSDQLLAADPENIDKVEWEQKKSSTYIYH
jgi:uncharacterized membrane protein YhiD involved in acid resistance